MGHPTCIIEGLACWLTLCILEKIICNSTNSVQISFIETLKLIVFSWTIWWCYWQNVLMINDKNNFLTVSWLSGLLSAEIFISTGEWGVQMPPLTSENSHFLRSGPQGATLVMYWPSSWLQRATIATVINNWSLFIPLFSFLIARPDVSRLTDLPMDKMADNLADDLLRCIFVNENCYILLKFVSKGPIDRNPALV